MAVFTLLFIFSNVALLACSRLMRVPSTHLHRRDTGPLFLPGGSFPVGTARAETIWTSTSPDSDVITSVISVLIPLPSNFPVHPPECEYLSYLRYRHVQGPSDSSKADRILTVMPGTFAGAATFEQVSRNIVLDSKSRYELNVEVWALDRRSNCLDDQTGILAAIQSKDISQAIGYYYNGEAIKGRKFGGFLTNDQIAFVGKMGLEQTVKDWYDLVVKEIPDAEYRAKKHYIGGHSLGGPVTAFFAMYDADGNVDTTSDAGYNQAAGFIAFDSTITPNLGGSNNNGNPLASAGSAMMEPLFELGYDALEAGLESGIIPRTLSALPLVINPEMFTIYSLLGAAVVIDPTGPAKLDLLPQNFNIKETFQVFNSKTYANFLAGSPSAFAFKFTNQAALGAIFSDVTNFVSILQLSVGFFKGAPVVEKSFPGLETSDVASNPNLKGLPSAANPRPLAIPDSTEEYYGWLNYNEVAADGSNVANDASGIPFTNASSEVTDINEFALALSAAPLDYSEHYFPTKLSTDMMFYNNGNGKEVMPSALHTDGYTKRPTLTLLAGEGPIIDEAKPNLAPGTYTVLPGYNHLDTIIAARKQNNGQPEVVMTQTTNFMAEGGLGILT